MNHTDNVITVALINGWDIYLAANKSSLLKVDVLETGKMGKLRN